jgi:hypothetical protein
MHGNVVTRHALDARAILIAAALAHFLASSLVLALEPASPTPAAPESTPSGSASAAEPGAVAPTPPSVQAPVTSAPAAGLAPEMRAARRAGEIHVDGKLDETAWGAAVPATEFTQLDPSEGQPASERTEVRVLVDDEAVYIGARLYDREPGKIRAQLLRRDESPNSDGFRAYIDSYHDYLTAFGFGLTAGGAVQDWSIGSGGAWDSSWDPVWAGAASVDSLGWTAEMRIPLSQLRYSSIDDATWGIQFERLIQRKAEDDFFAFSPKKDESGPAKYGHLCGLGSLHATRRLELLPYSLARSEHLHVARGNPFRDGSDQFGAAGLDLKYGLTSNLTLDGTVNPDFGQVEVDPAVVNLSAFETFYEERRPFFVEGADVFRYGQTRSMNSMGRLRVFHSRRIGRAPQRTLSGGQYPFVDAPDVTTIATAGKLTGKTARGWSVGALDAVTTRETADFVDSQGARGETAVEPRTNYFVGRSRRDLRGGNSVLGGLFTATNRGLADPGLESRLRAHAYVGGVDWNHAWANRHWAFDGFVVGSTVGGSSSAIAGTQASSSHYFQRPDLRSAHYDPTRTHLEGFASDLSLAKYSGKHWLGSIIVQTASPGFEVNDVGFQNRVDRTGLSTILFYKEDKPGRLLRNWDAFVFQNHAFNFDGDNNFAQWSASGDLQLHNYWNLNWRFEYNPPAFDDRLTRGGPVAGMPRGGRASFGFGSDSRRSTTYGADFSFARSESHGRDASYSVSLNLRPTSAVQINVSPTVDWSRDPAQYVDVIGDALATRTYKNRYVFGAIEQTTASIATRLNWTFTPRLSLQLYVQPLVVTGGYSEFKELHAPRGFDFDVYGRDGGTIERQGEDYVVDPDGAGPAASFGFQNPDFDFRSLRGNAVLRWEYRPGSTLFFVWQQSRSGSEPIGDFDLHRDTSALFHQRAENVFALKATYWFGS